MSIGPYAAAGSAKASTRLQLAVVLFVILAPVAWMVLSSFKESADVTAYPPRLVFAPTLENYRDLPDKLAVLGVRAQQHDRCRGLNAARARPRCSGRLCHFVPPVGLACECSTCGTYGARDAISPALVRGLFGTRSHRPLRGADRHAYCDHHAYDRLGPSAPLRRHPGRYL